jgi:hypothetical protein
MRSISTALRFGVGDYRPCSVPAQIDRVIATGLAKDSDQRYATTVEPTDAAREAITVPLHPSSRPDLPAAGTIHGQDTQLAATGRAGAATGGSTASHQS